MEIRFQIQGSASLPYDVTFINHEDGNLSAYCTCPAGENGKSCHHRIGVLKGQTTAIVSGNEPDVATVGSWLTGSDLEAAMKAVETAQKEADAAKKKLSSLKKELARSMRA